MAKLGAAFIALATALFAGLGSSYAAEADTPDTPVAYALLLDGKDAIYGQVVCKFYVRCQLFDNEESGVRLSLTLDSKRFLAGEVSVSCGKQDCSFLSGKTSTRLEQTRDEKRSGELDLYSGEANGIAMDLVYRERTKIGRIAILF
ncbi:hypothetical protein [Rhizobium sp. P44RR-XXIV]|uniref:hypothetical protein n=1 Tax=Rhizobium sp. P44RR-XXIV TaxID=1921145 RepID=UPI0009874C19|nr:hypothetical protein [Rhizobium sp. P44RR-XXIV]TIX89042.1 hypothetical protein BSK43_020660 [Rhizobium sp. P44RR-XXIV]